MSYILDALKKADAERERGGVPGLHAHPATAATAPHNTSQRTGVWLALTAALAVAGAVVALSPAPVVQQSAPAITAPAPTVSIAESRVTPAPPAAKPEPRRPPRPASPPAANAKPASSMLAITSAAAASAVAVAPLLGELPQDIRSQIPALSISGSVYSDNPSQRLLLVNGQVLPQGSAVAPDVTLVEIRVGSSEFSFRGTRFRLAH